MEGLGLGGSWVGVGDGDMMGTDGRAAFSSGDTLDASRRPLRMKGKDEDYIRERSILLDAVYFGDMYERLGENVIKMLANACKNLTMDMMRWACPKPLPETLHRECVIICSQLK